MYKGKIIIYDFEVFKYNTLLGTIILDGEDAKYFQTWDLNEIASFYLENINSLWVGHNNEKYDNLILQAIINNKNPYEVSQQIIESEDRRKPKLNFPLKYLDLMLMIDEMYSLKMTEAAFGDDISETEVSFDLDRELTKEEKEETEKYNRDDLNRTLMNYFALQNEIQTRFDLLEEFNLDISHLNDTKGKLGALCLGAKKVWGIEKKHEKPRDYPDLRLKNQELLDYYYQEKYLTSERLNLHICGADIKAGSGGMHAAQPHFEAKECLYFDVSGFYNLTMINRDLLPRSLSKEGKELYTQLYHMQLELKKKNPRKRAVYKIILLTVFGAQMNKFTDFYDPYRGNLVMITGQLYLMDLLEKLDGKVLLVQANTDGIIVQINDGYKKEDIIAIVEEWEKRTGYVIKKVPITDVHQRDVNCYMYKQDGKIEVKGEYKAYENWKDVFSAKTWKLKEPPIFSYIVVDFFMYGRTPEETVKKYENELRMFQYICKKGTYKYLEDVKEYKDGRVENKPIQKVNRVFASNNEEYNEMVYKVKNNKDGSLKKDKVTSLPDNIFIYNKDINDRNKTLEIKSRINYNYYVLRGYEKIMTFLPGDNKEKETKDDLQS